MGRLHHLPKTGGEKDKVMQGYRKLAIALIALGGTFFVELNEHQADVIIAVACAMIFGNAALGIGGRVAEALGNRVPRVDSTDTDSAGPA
jgi:hypothetical protein